MKQMKILMLFILFQRFISVPAKWIKTARQHVLNLYTTQKAYPTIFASDFGQQYSLHCLSVIPLYASRGKGILGIIDTKLLLISRGTGKTVWIIYAQISDNRYRKNSTSTTPWSCARKFLIFELKDSADALVERQTKQLQSPPAFRKWWQRPC